RLDYFHRVHVELWADHSFDWLIAAHSLNEVRYRIATVFGQTARRNLFTPSVADSLVDPASRHIDAALVAKDLDVLERTRQVPRCVDYSDGVIRKRRQYCRVSVGLVLVRPSVRRYGIHALGKAQVPPEPHSSITGEV